MWWLTNYTSWTRRLPLSQLHYRICSSSWAPRRPSRRSSHVSNCIHSWSADEHVQFWSSYLSDWIALRCPGRSYSQHLWERCPNHICHRGQTREDHRWDLHEVSPARDPINGSGQVCRCLGRGHREGRKPSFRPRRSMAGNRIAQWTISIH